MDNEKRIKITDWHLIPFIVILTLPLIIYTVKFETGSKNYFAIITTILLAIFIRLIFKVKPFVFVLLSLPMLFFSILYTVQVLEYDTYVNISTWYTLFDSHQEEMIEFVSGLKNLTIIIVIVEVVVYLFYLLFTFKKIINTKVGNKIKYLIFGLITFFIIDYFGNGATAEVFPLKSIQTLFDYVKTKRIESKYLEVKNNASFNATRISEFKSGAKETIVVVVGEALRRDRLEYYGYNKPTTPLMKEEDLIIFNDVVSAANQTINSLKRVFTLAEYLDEEDYWKYPSFIKAFKEVGFKTYWLTNQPVYGKHESEASFIAQESDVFISTKNKSYFKDGKGKIYDDALLKVYSEIINDKNEKKIIFIHVLGSHGTYKYRYSEKFNLFNKSESENERVNLLREYDNSVRFNDYFLNKVLGKLKKSDSETSFIMFSDHGESLFDNPTTCFHGSSDPSKSEVEIPLIMWFSNKFKENHRSTIKRIKNNVNQPILSSDFFHAFPSLYGIEFNKLKQENNFLGEDYIPKTNRKILNVNYELLNYNDLSERNANIDY